MSFLPRMRSGFDFRAARVSFSTFSEQRTNNSASSVGGACAPTFCRGNVTPYVQLTRRDAAAASARVRIPFCAKHRSRLTALGAWNSSSSFSMDVEQPRQSPRVPPLRAVELLPHNASETPKHVALLRSIASVAIDRSFRCSHDQAAHFVVDVVFKAPTSRLPTTRCNRTLLLTLHGSHAPGSSPAHRLQLHKSFDDFAALRYRVWAHTQRAHADADGACAYCNAFVTFICTSWEQPRLLVGIATRDATKRRLLAAFVRHFVQLTLAHDAQSRGRRRVSPKCDNYDAIVALVGQFFLS